MQPKQLGFDPGILTKLEFYLGKDSVFYPMYKFDSVFIYHLVLPQHSDYYITESLKQSLKKLFKINLVDVLNLIDASWKVNCGKETQILWVKNP